MVQEFPGHFIWNGIRGFPSFGWNVNASGLDHKECTFDQLNIQPHCQVSLITRKETLVWSGHVCPKIWDIANKRLMEGVGRSDF